MRGTGRLLLCLLVTMEVCRYPFELVTRLQVAFIAGAVTVAAFKFCLTYPK